MLRVLGGCAVLLASAWAGAAMAARLRRRVTVLGEFQAALELMERELSYRATAMPELLELLSQGTEGTVRVFFQSCGTRLGQLDRGFGAIWREELDRGQFPLTGEEHAALSHLGDVLGRYDREGQCAAIGRARGELETLRRKAEEERDRLGRVYQTVGLTAGALLVILLI